MKISTYLLAIALVAFTFISTSSYAQTDLRVQGSGRLFPIAVPQLCLETGKSKAAKEIPRVIAKDLDLSGYFQVLNASSYIETPGKCDASSEFAYSDWSIIGAEGLVKGVVQASGGELKVQMYLHDVQRQKPVLGKEYKADSSQIASIAHRFANEIMKFFTGKLGVFGTQIAFSSRVGRFKELFVMDMDGSNIRQLTKERGLAVSASWDPQGENLLYTSYRSRVPDLFKLDVFSGRIKQLTKGQALELGGEYSSDGRRILLSRTENGESHLVLLNADGSLLKTLTPRNGAIDVSPTWSPDDQRIAFCSNRAGGPQIYVMDADGSRARRVSFVTSDYCTSPAWSPDGRQLAYVCRADRGFQLFVSGSDGSNPIQLTSYGSNEDPSWSPDGRYIAFATTFGKGRTFNLAMVMADGSNLRQLTFSKTDDTQPAWGPFN